MTQIGLELKFLQQASNKLTPFKQQNNCCAQRKRKKKLNFEQHNTEFGYLN